MHEAWWASVDTLQQTRILDTLQQERKRHKACICRLTDAYPCRAIDAKEIPKYVNFYRQGARNALDAGFDGVEVSFWRKKAARLHCILCARFTTHY